MKRLVFCFDGTWNKLTADNPTNVVMTAESVSSVTDENISQLIFYDDGVGTAKGEVVTGGVFGRGLVKNMADGYRFLIFNYDPGDEIYVFGFSRGAYTARSFVGLLSASGILHRSYAAMVDEAIQLYRDRANTEEYIERAMRFRSRRSPMVCVSDNENQWRLARKLQSAPKLSIRYVGVWDTVGGLGIPSRFWIANLVNRRFRFHNTDLSDFVCSARHAIAIDERRKDFVPTLWENLDDLNKAAGTTSDSEDAKYRQVWFPGTHSSVGGGGDRRGLSDQALHWIWDGAMQMGLQLNTDPRSRIFELAPNYTEFIADSEEPSFFYRLMNIRGADRIPGPAHLHEVSFSARKRWHENPQHLQDQRPYRPLTLNRVAAELNKLKATDLGVGDEFRKRISQGQYRIYRVKPRDGLRSIAKRFYGSADDETKIFEANRDFIENKNKIDAGQVLRLPLDGLLANENIA